MWTVSKWWWWCDDSLHTQTQAMNKENKHLQSFKYCLWMQISAYILKCWIVSITWWSLFCVTYNCVLKVMIELYILIHYRVITIRGHWFLDVQKNVKCFECRKNEEKKNLSKTSKTKNAEYLFIFQCDQWKDVWFQLLHEKRL